MGTPKKKIAKKFVKDIHKHTRRIFTSEQKILIIMLELLARFDEEHNLEWNECFEMEGVNVLVGVPNKKAHVKLCIIKKRINNKTIQYGFISTGNFNKKTAKIYGNCCLITSNRAIMADINKIFNALKRPSKIWLIA